MVSFSKITGCIATLSVVALTSLAPAILSAASEVDVATTRILANQPVGIIKKDLAGVSLGGGATTYVNPTYLKSIDGIGIRYVRLETITADNRNLYDPASGKWNWTRLDQEIENIQATGSKVIANVFYTPRSHAFHSDNRYFYSYPKDYDEWTKYVSEIVRHVNIEKKYGIQYWEIGNEPSGGHFFRAPMSEFFRYYAVTARAIKQADPAAFVGGLGDNANYPEHWRNLFDYCLKNDAPVDFVSFHWYGQWTRKGDTSPHLFLQYASALKGLARAKFNRDLPVLLTEWNLVGEDPDPITAKVGAYLGAGLYWLQESVVDSAFYFRVQPHRKTLGSLLAADGQWRTLGRIFAHFSQLPEQRLNLVSVHPGITGLAARSGDERLVALLTRFDPDRAAITVNNKISVIGHGLRGRYRLTATLEDASTVELVGRDAVRPFIDRIVTLDPATPVDLEIPMSNYAVALVLIEKATGEAALAPAERILFQETFALDPIKGRTPAARLAGQIEQGGMAWKTYGNQPPVFAQDGGVVAGSDTGGGLGYGSAEARAPIALPAGGANPSSEEIKLTATVVLGQLKEWIGFGFLAGTDKDWWGDAKPLWIFLRPDGRLSISGNINKNPTYSVAGVAGFSAGTPQEVSIVYSPATQSVNIHVNGLNTTPGWGLATKSPLTDAAAAAGFYINGSNGPNAEGQLARICALGLTY